MMQCIGCGMWIEWIEGRKLPIEQDGFGHYCRNSKALELHKQQITHSRNVEAEHERRKQTGGRRSGLLSIDELFNRGALADFEMRDPTK